MAYLETTLQALRERLLARTDTAAFWTDEEARLAINEALRDWNLLTGRWRTRAQCPVTPFSVRVTLPAPLVFGMRVRYLNRPLDPTSLTELDLQRPQWRNERVTDGGDVPTIPMHWAPEDLQRIVIWPTLTVPDVIDVDGVAATPVLVEDADYVDLGAESLDPVMDFVLHLLTFKEGGPRWRATRGAWAALLRAAADANPQLRAHQVYRQVAGLDRRRDLHRQHDRPSGLDDVAAAHEERAG